MAQAQTMQPVVVKKKSDTMKWVMAIIVVGVIIYFAASYSDSDGYKSTGSDSSDEPNETEEYNDPAYKGPPSAPLVTEGKPVTSTVVDDPDENKFYNAKIVGAVKGYRVVMPVTQLDKPPLVGKFVIFRDATAVNRGSNVIDLHEVIAKTPSGRKIEQNELSHIVVNPDSVQTGTVDMLFDGDETLSHWKDNRFLSGGADYPSATFKFKKPTRLTEVTIVAAKAALEFTNAQLQLYDQAENLINSYTLLPISKQTIKFVKSSS